MLEKQMNESNYVRIFDTTLRDGEQSPGISLNVEEKVEIAEELADLGVDIVEAGFPNASQGDFEAVQAVAHELRNRPVVVCGLARTAFEDIDRCWEAIEPSGSPRIHTFIATSELHMKDKLGMTPDQVISAAAEAVKRARTYTDDVEFSPEDASRSNFDFMCTVLQAAVDAGATTLNIPDTVGYATPKEYAERIQNVRARVNGDYILSVHCHDDLGMAVANSLAGVEVGARQVEVAVNGIGERAGNAALEEVVMALETRKNYYGVQTGIDTTRLKDASDTVALHTGYPVQFNKAVVGRNAFAHEAGIHQDGMLKNRRTYEIIDPSKVGQESSLVYGKHSGTAAFRRSLQTMGMPTTIARQVRDAAKKSHEVSGRPMSDVDIEIIALEILGEEQSDTLVVRTDDISTSSRGGEATASISGTYKGNEFAVSGTNGGEIAAAQLAFDQLIPGYQLTGYESGEVSGEQGAKATGYAKFTLHSPEGITVTTYGEDHNVVHAAINAYIAGINCIERAKARTAVT